MSFIELQKNTEIINMLAFCSSVNEGFRDGEES